MTVEVLSARVDITPATPDSWQTVDLDSYATVPSGAFGAIIDCVNSAGTSYQYGCLAGDSTLDSGDALALRSRFHQTRFVKLGAGNTVKLYTDLVASVKFYLIGFLTGGGAMYADGFDKTSSITAINGWYDVDCSGDLPASAKYAIVWLEPNGTSASGNSAVIMDVRKNGSAFASPVASWGAMRIVEMDASRIFEIYSATTTPSYFRVVGYLEDGHYVENDAGGTAFGPPTTASTWEAAGQSFDASKLLIFFRDTTGYGGADLGGIRPKGTSWVALNPKPGYRFVRPGTDSDVELYHSDATPTIEFAEFGYFVNPAASSTPKGRLLLAGSTSGDISNLVLASRLDGVLQ